MFKRNRSQPRYPQNPANKAVNRILTYGLIFFIIYAVYNNHNSPVPKKSAAEINYTQINWANYVKITNLISGEESLYNFAGDKQLTLDLTPKDLSKVYADETTAVYQLQFDKNAGSNSIYSFKH